MAKSEDTFIPLPVNERELAIEDLAFSSNKKNDKAIKYAIECINKLAKIEEIIKRTEGTLGLDNYTVQQIKEVLENE